MKGKLVLVPTPIDNESPLEPVAESLLRKAFEQGEIIAVEEAKACRRRWLHWGLPRESIETFVLYNEHTRDEEAPNLIRQMQKGKSVYLMSDCGLPAFCDPGKKLVNLCHEHGIRVTSTPFSNSVLLALALSGFDHERFVFEGFIPARGGDRTKALKRILSQSETSIVMDTAYRLPRLLEELKEINPGRGAFLAMDLNKSEERLIRAKVGNLKAPEEKKEFVLVIGGKS